MHERLLNRDDSNLDRIYVIRGVKMSPMDYTVDEVLSLIGQPLQIFWEPGPLSDILGEYHYEDYVLLFCRVNTRKGVPFIVWDIYCK